MAFQLPPQPPPSFNLAPSSFFEEAEKLVKASAQVWDKVAQIRLSDATFENAILPIIHDENHRLGRASVLAFFESVAPDKELRNASHDANIIMAQDNVDRWAREDVFRVVDAVWQKAGASDIDPESSLFVEKLREQFLHTGQGLDQEEKTRFKEAFSEIQTLKSEYRHNIDSSMGGLWLTLEELEGVPASYLQRWKADGNKRWVNHRKTNYLAVLRSAVRADVRQRVWTEVENMVKDSNGQLLRRILLLRDELARLLGYRNHAESREAERIMKTEQAVEFLANIRGILTELGSQELASLKALKAADFREQSLAKESPVEFFWWDNWFYKDQAKLKAFNVDQEKVAEYFPFERSLFKMLSIFEALFGLKFVHLPTGSSSLITVWHPEVRVYAVWNDESEGNGFLGYLFLDVFPRDHKYSHVGHYKLQPGFTRQDGTRHYPSAALVANFSPPTDALPSLLKYNEVVSCFHEIGHALHNLTSCTQYARFHGTAVPRDFCEIPSVMLEHLFWDPEVVRSISGHYSGMSSSSGEGAKLPDDLAYGLVASRFANIGLSQLSNLMFSMYDIFIHTPPDHETLCHMNLNLEFNKLRKDVCLISGPEDLGHGLEAVHGFSRYRFPIGYDSVYYSYLLAGAFSYDIFETRIRPLLPSARGSNSRREIVNDELRNEFRRYRRMVLQPGGSSVSCSGLMKEYLGRDPSPDAYIQMLKGLLNKV